ncbi:hypothetical protein ACSBR1_003268 [Camellia fascicularis]
MTGSMQDLSLVKHNKGCYCGNSQGFLGGYWRIKKFKGLEYHLFVGFFFTDLQGAQKPPLPKLLLMLPNGAELYSMYVGEGEALLHNTFRRARLAAPSIIFCDEADVVAAKRGGKSSSNIAVGERLLSTLLKEMDGLEQAKGILVLAAINRPHAIDAALMRPGRFDLGLCREAGIVALREDISASVVCNRHFQTVWKSLKPALTREEVNSYSSFMKNPSLISSGSSKASAKQNSKHTTSLLSSVGPVSIGILSFILLAGVCAVFEPSFWNSACCNMKTSLIISANSI